MKKSLVLKSADIEKYPNLEVECYAVSLQGFKKYLSSVSPDNIVYAYNNGELMAHSIFKGSLSTKNTTVNIDGNEYIFSTINMVPCDDRSYLLVNYSSNHNFDLRSEGELVEKDKFYDTHYLSHYATNGPIGCDNDCYTCYNPICENVHKEPVFISKIGTKKIFAKIDENLLVVTNSGKEMVFLKDGYVCIDDDFQFVGNEEFKNSYTVVGRCNKDDICKILKK